MIRCLAATLVFTLASYCCGDEPSDRFSAPPLRPPELSDRNVPAVTPSRVLDQRLSQTDDSERLLRANPLPQTAPRRAETTPDESALIRRIEQLENRIAVLEAQQARSGPQDRSGRAPSTRTLPPYYQDYPAQRIQPNQAPTPPSENGYIPPSSPALPPSNPNQNWQRFNFNGQWFYIVPVGSTNDTYDSRTR